jgi:hypothetical protein
MPAFRRWLFMDRRKMLALLGVSPALVAGMPSLASAAPEPASAAARSESNGLVTVLNPGIATQFAERVPLTPRLHTLEGKKIYLVDTDWDGQTSGVLQEMQTWFAQHMPSVKIIYKMKRGSFEADDPGLWKEIAASGGDGVILGVAG